MNQNSESKQKIEPELGYRCSYRRAHRFHQLFAQVPHRRLGGTCVGLTEDLSGKRLRDEIIRIVTGLSLIVTIITLGVAWNRFGGGTNDDFLICLLKSIIVLPFPFLMLCYHTKSAYGSVIRLCGLLVPITVSVISCILCRTEPDPASGVQLLFLIRKVALIGVIIYLLLQTIGFCIERYRNRLHL